MILHRLKKRIKLCKRNLKSKRVKCCASCPFEDDILEHYPELEDLFNEKRITVFARRDDPAVESPEEKYARHLNALMKAAQ